MRFSAWTEENPMDPDDGLPSMRPKPVEAVEKVPEISVSPRGTIRKLLILRPR